MQAITNQHFYNVFQRQNHLTLKLQPREQIVVYGWMLPSTELEEE